MRKIVIIVLGAIVLFYAARFFLRDERTIIREMLSDAAKKASFEGQIHPFERLAWAKELSYYVGQDCKFVLLTPNGTKEVLSGREALREKLLLFRSALDQFAMAVLSPDVEVDQSEAHVTLTARGIGREPGREDYFKEEHALRVDLKKISGHWEIVRAQNTEPYEGEWEVE